MVEIDMENEEDEETEHVELDTPLATITRHNGNDLLIVNKI